MTQDGSITFYTNLDNKELEKQYRALTRKIDALNQKITQHQTERMPLLDQSLKLGSALDAAKAKLYEMQSASKGTYELGEIQGQKIHVSGLQSEWTKINNSIDRYNASIKRATVELDLNKEKAGLVAKELSNASTCAGMIAPALSRAQKGLARFGLRLREVVRSALIFTVITQALSKFRDWMGKLIQTNAEAASSTAQLKGALLTLAQPLVSVLIPAFTFLVTVLTRVISTMAQLFSMLTGGTIKNTKQSAKALNAEEKALDGAGAAAEDAGKAMAGFDEINTLSGGAESKTGAGGGEADPTAPDFDFKSDLTDGQLKNILGLVESVGAAFLAWTIGRTLKKSLKDTLILALGIYFAIQFVKNLFNAWTNGVDMSNLIGMLASVAGMAVAFGIALGPVAAGISLVVTGLSMLTAGFHDAAVNGWNLENLLLSVAGILAAGIGIALITGSWIPLLLSGIAALLLAVAVAWGRGDELIAGMKEILRGFIDFFVGVFTGDLDRAMKGVGEIFGGLKAVLSAILDSLRDMFLSFFDWLDEKTGGKIHWIITFVKTAVSGVLNWIKTTIGDFLNAFQQILGGVIAFLSGVFTGDWDKAWGGLGDIVSGVMNLITSAVEAFVNFFVRAINKIIGAINTLRIDVPDWVPGFGGETFGFNIAEIPELHIPRLATGAVIPPNREFMAVLGDQKSGNNYEVPDAKLRQLIREAMGSRPSGDMTVILELDRQQIGKLVYKLNKDESRRIGVQLVEV